MVRTTVASRASQMVAAGDHCDRHGRGDRHMGAGRPGDGRLQRPPLLDRLAVQDVHAVLENSVNTLASSVGPASIRVTTPSIAVTRWIGIAPAGLSHCRFTCLVIWYGSRISMPPSVSMPLSFQPPSGASGWCVRPPFTPTTPYCRASTSRRCRAPSWVKT